MKRRRKKSSGFGRFLTFVICVCFVLFGGSEIKNEGIPYLSKESIPSVSLDLQKLPEYTGTPYVTINGNEPEFNADAFTTQSFETYSSLDYLGRCGTAYANIGTDLMPDEDRESISQIHPTGWQSTAYDIVDGEYLYNRCHLIAFQLAGENANEKNLITGTRYMNVEGMLPFEERVADYVRDTGNHVLYRVTPVFSGTELVARGVQMEGESVEDQGKGISFNVYVFNVQPGIEIDYATGDSRLALSGEDQDENTPPPSPAENEEGSYVLNNFSHKFHLPSCDGAASMNPANKEFYSGSREELIQEGYSPCQSCCP